MKAARQFVTATLTEHLPKGWRVLDTETPLDRISRLTVRVSNQRIRRAAEAPIGAYDSTLNVRLISPNTDHAKAEGELEDAMDVLLGVIEDHFGTAWEEATKVADPETNTLAWDVPVHVYTSRKED